MPKSSESSPFITHPWVYGSVFGQDYGLPRLRTALVKGIVEDPPGNPTC